MISVADNYKKPDQQVFLQDKGMTISYDGDMSEENIGFHAGINVYGKSPQQAIMDVINNAEPMISDEEWIKAGEGATKRATEAIKAVPEFMGAAAAQIPSDIQSAVEFLSTGKTDEERIRIQREAAERPVKKITDFILTDIVSRMFAAPRAIVFAGADKMMGDDVSAQDVVKDFAREVINPGTLENPLSPEKRPLTPGELSGGAESVVPRAIGMGALEFLSYSMPGAVDAIPKMIENYKISEAKTFIRNNLKSIHDEYVNNQGYTSEAAWNAIKDKVYFEAEIVPKFVPSAKKAIAQKKSETMMMYGGLPVPGNSGEIIKSVGSEVAAGLKKPEVLSGLAKAASDLTIQEVPISKIKLSKDVPNFKAGADPSTGIVPEEQLKGKYERYSTDVPKGTPPKLLDSGLRGSEGASGIGSGSGVKSENEVVKGSAETLTSSVSSPPKSGSPKSSESEIKPPYKERGFVTSNKEELPELKVAGQYIPRSTDVLAQRSRDLIRDNIDEVEKLAMSGTDDFAISTGAELLKHYTDLAAKATDAAAKDALYEKAVNLGNDMAERLTELGRSVQAASILARMTPEGQIRFAAGTIKKYNREVAKNSGPFGMNKPIPELMKQQAKDIADKFEEFSRLPDGEEKAMKWKALQDYVSDLVPTPLMKKITAVWKAGLLTGIKTHGLNTFSNFFHATTEIAKDIPAAGIDTIASLFTGRRSMSLTLRGIPGGVKEGFNRGWQFLKTGYDQRNIMDKFDYKRVNMGKSKFAKALQAYEETIFKLLGAEDQVFYYGAKARSIYDQAITSARNKGLRGKAFQDHVNSIVENPSDKICSLAVADAETAVFQNETSLGKGAAALKRAVPLTEFILPFSKTPSAVAFQVLNYSPVGAVRTIMRNMGSGKFDQRDFSQGMGRALLGIPILWMGYELFRQGNMTLDRPTTEREKELWKAEGRKENSIKIGDKYRSASVLGPAGNLMLLGGQFAQALNSSGSPTEAMSTSLFGGMKSFTEQTFLTGISAATDALKDPKRYGDRFASGLISSIIPTLVGNVATATDRVERRVEDIPGALVARIPVLRGSLQPQIDILGQERVILENFFEIMMDPSRPSTERGNGVINEIRRIVDSGFAISTTQLGDKEGYGILTAEQNTELWQKAGAVAFEKISAFMGMDQYDSMEDEDRAKEINKIFQKAKVAARAEQVLNITMDLQGQDVIDKLSEAKKDGLLNKEVLELYKRMR